MGHGNGQRKRATSTGKSGHLISNFAFHVLGFVLCGWKFAAEHPNYYIGSYNITLALRQQAGHTSILLVLLHIYQTSGQTSPTSPPPCLRQRWRCRSTARTWWSTSVPAATGVSRPLWTSTTCASPASTGRPSRTASSPAPPTGTSAAGCAPPTGTVSLDSSNTRHAAVSWRTRSS